MTPAQILADTLQVDPARVEAALHGHGLTVVRNALENAADWQTEADMANAEMARLRDLLAELMGQAEIHRFDHHTYVAIIYNQRFSNNDPMLHGLLDHTSNLDQRTTAGGA